MLDSYTKTDGTQSQTRYYYVLNLQGDVVALMTASGSIWATYTYDAWGKPLQVLNGNNTALSLISTYFANVNPLRYRGYYYDTELGFYYLQSRYYDPSIGRFVNADAAEIATLAGLDINQTNLFQYCADNPVQYVDDNGDFCLAALAGGAIAGAIIGAASSVINSCISGEQIDIKSVIISAAIGAVTGAISALIGQYAPVVAQALCMDTIGGRALWRMFGSAVNGFIVGILTQSTGGSTFDSTWTGATTTVATFVGAVVPSFTGSAVFVATCNFITGFYVGGTTESIASIARAGGQMVRNSRGKNTVQGVSLGYIGLVTRGVANYRGNLIL